MLKDKSIDDFLIFVNNESNIDSKVGGQVGGASCWGVVAPLAPPPPPSSSLLLIVTIGI